ncbi:hypothetical protein [Catenibacterium sp.]|uniref:hypothetical protein n=1 Tax=Catenibacterium sp. TaxID=2049022 RepID=UPI00307A9BA7
MKKWLTPSAIQENLMADAAVAVTSCGSYNATLYCAIPGIDKNHVNDGPIPRLDDSGLWHLSECINPGTADITAGTGMESGYNPHPIHDIKIGTKVDSMKSYVDKNIGNYNGSTFSEGGIYKASWKSDANGDVYNHYGLAKVNKLTNFDPAHPFRS